MPVGAMASSPQVPDNRDHDTRRDAGNEIISALGHVRDALGGFAASYYARRFEFEKVQFVNEWLENVVQPIVYRAMDAQPEYAQVEATDLQRRQMENIELNFVQNKWAANLPQAMCHNVAGLLIALIPPYTVVSMHNSQIADEALSQMVKANVEAMKIYYKAKFQEILDVVLAFANALDLFTETGLNKRIASLQKIIAQDCADGDYVYRRDMERLRAQRIESKGDAWNQLPAFPINRAGDSPGDGDCFYTSLAMLAGWNRAMGLGEASREMRRKVINYMRASADANFPATRYAKRWKWRYIADNPDNLQLTVPEVFNEASGPILEPSAEQHLRFNRLDWAYDDWLCQHARSSNDTGTPGMWAQSEHIAAAAEMLGWRINIYTYVNPLNPALGFQRYPGSAGGFGSMESPVWVGIVHESDYTGARIGMGGSTSGTAALAHRGNHFRPIMNAITGVRGGPSGMESPPANVETPRRPDLPPIDWLGKVRTNTQLRIRWDEQRPPIPGNGSGGGGGGGGGSSIRSGGKSNVAPGLSKEDREVRRRMAARASGGGGGKAPVVNREPIDPSKLSAREAAARAAERRAGGPEPVREERDNFPSTDDDPALRALLLRGFNNMAPIPPPTRPSQPSQPPPPPPPPPPSSITLPPLITPEEARRRFLESSQADPGFD